ncbi:hypothetical protein [Slackia piriformis]|uniref:hypothetical protein n=1 Tax=Slackia piriformis TaxID=626934 RepID=UPI0032BF8DA7
MHTESSRELRKSCLSRFLLFDNSPTEHKGDYADAHNRSNRCIYDIVRFGTSVPDAGDLDIGRMIQSFIGDGAAFKLRGNRTRRRTPLYSKIPLDGEEMFESGYTIDDLLIGNGKQGILDVP